jgi:hypothetical protein
MPTIPDKDTQQPTHTTTNTHNNQHTHDVDFPLTSETATIVERFSFPKFNHLLPIIFCQINHLESIVSLNRGFVSMDLAK